MNTPTLVAASTYAQYQLWLHENDKDKSDYIFVNHDRSRGMLGYSSDIRVIVIMPDLTRNAEFGMFLRRLETKYSNIRWKHT